MELRTLIQQVKEKNLSKDQLEDYREQLSSLFAEMSVELAEVEKEKALYFDTVKTAEPQSSDISIKRRWQAREKGLREIVLKRYLVATKELLSSLKSRLFNIY